MIALMKLSSLIFMIFNPDTIRTSYEGGIRRRWGGVWEVEGGSHFFIRENAN